MLETAIATLAAPLRLLESAGHPEQLPDHHKTPALCLTIDSPGSRKWECP